MQTDPFFANSCLKAEHLVPFQDGLLLSQQLSALCLPLLFEYIVDGIRVVNSDKESYHCSNYKSALELLAAEKMLKIISSELSEGMISEVTESPHRFHVLGAVAKPNKGVRPITDF